MVMILAMSAVIVFCADAAQFAFLLDKKGTKKKNKARALRHVAQALPSDYLTAFGSELETRKRAQPVATIVLGFDGCGVEKLAQVLNKHPDIIGGTTPMKNYFTSRKGGNCNRLSIKNFEGTAFQRYMKSCFNGSIPHAGQTTLDISPQYGLRFRDIAPQLEEMKKEATFRFLAIVCNPRERAVNAVRANLLKHDGMFSSSKLNSVVSDDLRKQKAGKFVESMTTGDYATLISGWTAKIPKDSVLVVNSASLRQVEMWKRIYQHIGVTVPTAKALRTHIDKLETQRTASEFQLIDPTIQKRMNIHYDARDALLWRQLNAKWW